MLLFESSSVGARPSSVAPVSYLLPFLSADLLLGGTNTFDNLVCPTCNYDAGDGVEVIFIPTPPDGFYLLGLRYERPWNQEWRVQKAKENTRIDV